MKRLLPLLLLCATAFGQATNPQNTFSTAVSSASPSLWLNFNDATTNFVDSISQLSFNQTNAYPHQGTVCSNDAASGTSIACTFTSTAGDTLVVFITNATTVSSLVDSLGATSVFIGGAAAANPVYYFADVAAGSHTITAHFSTSASYPIIQVVDVVGASASSPIDASNFATGAATYTPSISLTTATANDLLVGGFAQNGSGGTWSPGIPIFNLASPTYTSNVVGTLKAPAAGAYTFTTTSTVSLATNNALIAVKLGSPTGPGTVTPQQPGFDSTIPLNLSAEFPYNAWNAAPNMTLGAFDWFDPMTIMVQVDRLNWDRTGTLVLASKGDISSTTSGYWELYLQMNGQNSQLCFLRSGYGTAPTHGAPGGVSQKLCTGGMDVMPNGYNYNIVVEQGGTGAGCTGGGCADMNMYINGLHVGASSIPASGGSAYWFGMATVNVSGGTGYADSTAFTSTGGGTNCTVTGTMNSSGGVPLTTNGFSFTTDNGCTTTAGFSIVLTSPTGTGATFTYGLGGQSMNATNYPVLVPGAVSAGVFEGIDSSDSAQTPTYIDEFAEFPSALSFTQLSNIFYETKFYQLVVNSSTEPVLVLDNDAGGDLDNFFSLQMLIALHQQGTIRLAGAVIEDQSVTCEATWRQMLDQAGLNDIPLAVPATFPENSGTGMCTAANVNTYNASTPQSNAAWEPAVTMYRTIFAKYPTTPIDIVSGAGLTALAEFMESPADSISPLTGLQLIAQDAANGGAIYAQGGGCTASSPPATTPCTGGIGGNLGQDYPSAQYVLTHNGALPIYWIGGTPQSAGPGILSTRTARDPMFLMTTTAGTDVRQCYDCLAVEAAVSSYFYGGVQIGYSGGTGYANSTPFTLSGGGPNCQGSGFMTASGGVPNGIEFSWGASAVGSYSGLGQGCTSAPTVNLAGATGTGVTLTAYPTLVCGTDTVSKTGSTWGDSFTSATCSNQYISPGTAYTNQTPVSGAPMEWFINSLADPSPNGQTRAY